MKIFIVSAQVNKRVPRTFGDALIHVSHIDFAVKHDAKLPSHGGAEPSKEEKQIGKLIAENLVDNGATLQLGIGSIPDAVLSSLKSHKDLGIHSEMFADGVVDLVNEGCITNSKKTNFRGQIVGSFCVGTQKLYDFMDNNPSIGKFIFFLKNYRSTLPTEDKSSVIKFYVTIIKVLSVKQISVFICK